MTTRAERARHTPVSHRDVVASLTVTLEVGTRVATARCYAEAGRPVQIVVDDAVLLVREVARPSWRATARRLATVAPVVVRDTRGRRLMRSVLRHGRCHTQWTGAGLATLAAAGWMAITTAD